MTTVTKSPRSRKPLRPVSGRVRVLRPVGSVNATTGEVSISGKCYYLTVHATGYRLTGWDRQHRQPTAYDLPADLSGCDCPDAVYAGERPGGCKHRRALAALKAAGKLAVPEQTTAA